MTAQTNKAIESEVNSLLLVSGSNNKRATSEKKELYDIRLGEREDGKKSDGRIRLKVWKMMTHEARIAMRSGEEVKIGIVKDSAAKTGKPVGGKMSQDHKKSRAKFLRLSQSEGKKNEAAFMKSVDEFINNCGGPS